MNLVPTISEDKRMNLALESANGELADITAALDEHSIVAVTDARGKITRVNDKFCAISQYSRRELIGQDHRIINSGHHPKEFIRNLWVTISKGEVWKGEIKNRAKDGSFYWVDTTIVPFLGPDGKPVQFVAIRTDITEGKRMNLALESANHELESFSYSVSHDLRAPLRAIDGFTRILEEDYSERFDDEGRRCLQTVQGEAQRMGNLIDDLLNFSRLGRQQVSFVSVNMAALTRSVFEGLNKERPDQTSELTVGDLPRAHGDPAMLRQLLVNLLGNALKYSSQKELSRIEVGSESQNGENTYFVRDNGAGFDMRYLDKLFGIFQRLHTDDEFEGTGVGLALVKRIVLRHGGRVWAEGRCGEGATFFFTLRVTSPLARPDETALLSRAPEPGPANSRPANSNS
jgi:PAS domain S-box-containing protein